jgi:glutamate racemase
MKMNSRLGIIDWGIGGISIYKLIKSRLGIIGITYFSDTGAIPYGKMTRPQLVSRLNDVINFLASRGITHLVIGCNAASTALPFLDTSPLKKVEGVIASAVDLVDKTQPSRLGLIAGRRTILSGVYRKALADRHIKVNQRIAQPLSGLIENGDVLSPILREHCRQILLPIRNCSHLVLACTHYPAISDLLKEFVSPETIFIDPAGELVNRVRRWNLPAGGSDLFMTSGDPEKMKMAALNAFGVKIPKVHTQSIP